MKKIFISADIEGITDVTSWSETIFGEEGYEKACLQMSLEVEAACKAVIESGYKAVVKDGHGSGMNIDHNILPRGTELIRGWMQTPKSMLSCLDDTFYGIIYIGYHSAAGTNENPLSHTVSNTRYNWIKINEKFASEFNINSLIASELGVKSIFLSGDDGICKEAQKLIPSIDIFATKKGIGGGTLNKHPKDSIEEIENIIKKSLVKNHNIRKIEDEYILEVNFKEHSNAKNASWYPNVELIDTNTIKIKCDSLMEMITAFSYM